MDESSNKLVEQLVSLLHRAAVIAAKLQGDSPERDTTVAAMVAAKIERRECLACGRICTSDELYRRGLDTKHYQQSLRIMSAGDATEAELMAAGVLGPKSPGGPKKERSALDSFGSRSRPTLEQDKQKAAKDLKKLHDKAARQIKK